MVSDVSTEDTETATLSEPPVRGRGESDPSRNLLKKSFNVMVLIIDKARCAVVGYMHANKRSDNNN